MNSGCVVKQKPKIPYEDEDAMTQIFGKAQYQKGRTTVKDPYLHFQNEAKHRASRVPSPKRADGEFRAVVIQPAFLSHMNPWLYFVFCGWLNFILLCIFICWTSSEIQGLCPLCIHVWLIIPEILGTPAFFSSARSTWAQACQCLSSHCVHSTHWDACAR